MPNNIKIYSKDHNSAALISKNNTETYLYEDKKLTVRGCAYKVTLLFPMPGSGTETAENKLKYLINGCKDKDEN